MPEHKQPDPLPEDFPLGGLHPGHDGVGSRHTASTAPSAGWERTPEGRDLLPGGPTGLQESRSCLRCGSDRPMRGGSPPPAPSETAARPHPTGSPKTVRSTKALLRQALFEDTPNNRRNALWQRRSSPLAVSSHWRQLHRRGQNALGIKLSTTRSADHYGVSKHSGSSEEAVAPARRPHPQFVVQPVHHGCSSRRWAIRCSSCRAASSSTEPRKAPVSFCRRDYVPRERKDAPRVFTHAPVEGA